MSSCCTTLARRATALSAETARASCTGYASMTAAPAQSASCFNVAACSFCHARTSGCDNRCLSLSATALASAYRRQTNSTRLTSMALARPPRKLLTVSCPLPTTVDPCAAPERVQAHQQAPEARFARVRRFALRSMRAPAHRACLLDRGAEDRQEGAQAAGCHGQVSVTQFRATLDFALFCCKLWVQSSRSFCTVLAST